MRRYLFLALFIMLILVCTSLTQAIIYRDNFNRPNEGLRTSPHWKCAHGAYYGYQIYNNRAVSVYYPDAGGLTVDKYARVAHQGQTYQRTAIDFTFPEVTQDGYSPSFFLNLNWAGPELFASTYRIGLRGIKDFCLMKLNEAGEEEITSGWKVYPNGPLSAKTMYRLTLERKDDVITGTISAADGTVIGTAQITDNGDQLNGGNVILTANGGAAPGIKSVEWDNFLYELSNLEEIKASDVNSVRPVLDGKLTEKCWQIAQTAEGFYKINGTGRAETSARAQIVYDKENLYVSLYCPLKDAEEVKAARKLKPDQMFVGNTMEIFLDPFLEHRRKAGLDNDLSKLFYHHLGAKIFRFAVNAANGRYSELMGLPWYKVPWKSATHIGEDFWSAELAIPFASLSFVDQIAGGVVPGWTDQWGVNFAFDQTAWVPQFDLEGYPLSFGTASNINIDIAPYKWVYLIAAGPRVVGDIPLVFNITDSIGSKGKVKVIAREILYDDNKSLPPFKAQEVVGQHTGIFGGISYDMKIPIKSPADHLVLLSVVDAETGKILSNRPVLFQNVQVGSGVFDRSFYMKESTVELTLKIGTEVKPGQTVCCNLRKKDGKDILQSKTVKLNAQNMARVVFDSKCLPFGQYSITIIVSGYEDYPFTETFKKLPSKPGAVQYTDLGVILRDGKPFFPFGMYYIINSMSEEFAKEYSEAGFNTFLMEWGNADSFIKIVKRMEKHEIVPILSIQNMAEQRASCAEETDYSRKTMLEGRFPTACKSIRMISEQAGNNILAWYTRDEPNEDMYDLVRGLHDIANRQDPYHPTMTVIFTPHLFPAYQDATDILGPDIYSRGSTVGNAMAKAVKDMCGKPVFAVLQTFYEAGGKMPTRMELRNMTFLSIIRGVTGVLYFAYQYGGPPMAERDPETWKDLKELAGHIRQLTPVILSDPISMTHLQKTGDMDGNVIAKLYDYEDCYYVIAVNQEKKPVNGVNFVLEVGKPAGIQVRTAEVLYENRDVMVANGNWNDDFASYAVHIYKIKKSVTTQTELAGKNYE